VATVPSLEPNYAEIAKGLAELQDFRLLFYVLIVLLVGMVIERAWAGHSMRREREKLLVQLATERKEMGEERKDMWKVADKFSEAATQWSDQTDKLVIELQVLRALTARAESTGLGDGR